MEEESYLKMLIGKKVDEVDTNISQIIPLRGKDEKDKEFEMLTSVGRILFFDNYNFRLIINNKFDVEPIVNDFNDFVGHIILHVNETKEFAELKFDNGATITVDLRDDAYLNDPEAMVLYGPDAFCAVWN